MKKILLCGFLLLLTNLLSAQEVHFQKLPDTVWVAVSLQAPLPMPAFEQSLLLYVGNRFEEANELEKHKVKFMLTPDTAFADMHLKVVSCQLATNADKSSSLLLSILGVAAPVALVASGVPVPIVFFRTPQNRYFTSVTYSEHMLSLGFSNEEELLRKVSTGYFSTDARNKLRVAHDFGKWMASVSREWNHEYNKASKQEQSVPATEPLTASN